MNRGRRGETVFPGKDDYLSFIDLLKEATETWNVRIAAYCLMSKHYHLLIQTPEANVSRCMRHINGIYTQRYNRLHNADGQLFRGRFKSVLVDADSYLLELLKYIHRNPLRAGIVDEVGKYPWSSHKGYLSHSEKWDWIYKDFILSILTKEKKNFRKAYKDLISQEESKSILKFFSRGNLPAILGSQDFIDLIREKFYKQSYDRHVPQSRILAPSIAHIKRIVEREYNISSEVLVFSRRGFFNEPRSVAIYLSRKYSAKTLLEIGTEFNMSQYSSVSSVVDKMKTVVAKDKKIRKRIHAIEKIVNKGH
jgi:REP element-mobilizing transposase RayT